MTESENENREEINKNLLVSKCEDFLNYQYLKSFLSLEISLKVWQRETFYRLTSIGKLQDVLEESTL